MKVLFIHNFYKSSLPSGEDSVFRQVIIYEKYNDNIPENSGKLNFAFGTIWSNKVYKELQAIIKKEKPDVAHFHNIWYLISLSAYYACKDAGIPVVQTCHNS